MTTLDHKQTGLRRSGRVAVLLVAAVLAGAPLPASSQVLEIGPTGGVKVYDGPRVFRSDGSEDPLKSATFPRRHRVTPSSSHALADQAAGTVALSPDLIEAVAWNESRLRPGLVSSAGAIGEMQLMPETARALGVNPYNSRQNYLGGAAYLKSLMHRYDGDLVLSLAAYNAGPGAVSKYGGVPPFKETRQYVSAILDRLSARASAAPEERH